MHLNGLVAKLRRSARATQPSVTYTTEPAPPFLFERSPRHVAILEASKKTRFIGFSPPGPNLIRVSKFERIGGLLGGSGPIRAEVSHASLEFVGIPRGETFIELSANADAKSEGQARQLLNQVQIHHQNGHVRFITPHQRRSRRCSAEFVILCLNKRYLKVRGTYAAIHLADTSGDVDVETTHARITLLNVTSMVNARVQEGIIDYSSQQGFARLFAGWELNLEFPRPLFSGEMEATAEGPVRVLLPPGFATPFEATIAKNERFVCRADIASLITKREHDGRIIFKFREDPPVIRLTSLNGPIVFDNRDERWDVANEAALARPRKPTLSASASVNPALAWPADQ